jgi:hypothetical protein
VKARVKVVRAKVSPGETVLVALSAPDHKKVPAVEAVQREMWLIVSPAEIVQELAILESDTEPPEIDPIVAR